MYKLTGRLNYNVSFTAKGNPIVSIELFDRVKSLKMVDELHGAEKVSVSIGKHDPKRSTNANSYYWTMLDKLSKALQISRPYCHNLMLRRYGTLEEFDGQIAYWVIPDTEEATRKADEAEDFHIKPTSQVQEAKDGSMWRTYIKLKGSHAYSREEFRKLVEGLLDECRIQGIETKSKEEVDSLLASYRGGT